MTGIKAAVRRMRLIVMVMSLLATMFSGIAIQIVAAPAAHAQGSYDNGAIADKALTYLGQWGGNACKDAVSQHYGTGDSGGQCRAFVNCIVAMVSKGTQNLGESSTDYFAALVKYGAEITDVNNLAKGDVVQKYVSSSDLHTFIIVSKGSGNSFSVVDSNSDGNNNEIVRQHSYTVVLNSTMRAFRLGTVNGASQYVGHIIKKASDHTTSWLVEGDLKKHWIPTGGDYNCFVATGAPVDDKLSDAAVAAITDAGTDYAKCTPPPPAYTPPPPVFLRILNYNSSSGMVEAAKFDQAAWMTRWASSSVTPEYWHQGSDVQYSLGDYNHDGIMDLYQIQSANTASGHADVTVFNGATQFTTKMLSHQPTVDGLHSASDVNYLVGDYDKDGKPDIFVVLHNNSPNGYVQVRVMYGSTNYSQQSGWSLPEYQHGEGVSYVLSSCNATGAPNLFQILHLWTGSGMTEVKEFSGNTSYQQQVGGPWVTPEGWHGDADVNYSAIGCNANGMPNIEQFLHQNTGTNTTEVKEFDGSMHFTTISNWWHPTADGLHSDHDVHYVAG